MMPIKNAGIACALWFFFGMLGAHRFYAGRIGSGATILTLTILSAILTVVFVGFVLIVVPAIWVLIDAFLIPGMVRDYNNRLIERLKLSRLHF
jgi:TM2 domain-containing membrane protein YozV